MRYWCWSATLSHLLDASAEQLLDAMRVSRWSRSGWEPLRNAPDMDMRWHEVNKAHTPQNLRMRYERGTWWNRCPNMSQYRSSMVFATSRSFKSDVLGLFSMSPRNAGPCLTHQRPPATSLKWTELAVNVQTQNIVTHLSMHLLYLSFRAAVLYLYICTSVHPCSHTHTQTHMGRTTLQRRTHRHTLIIHTHTHIYIYYV